jgi:hypothetical protein
MTSSSLVTVQYFGSFTTKGPKKFFTIPVCTVWVSKDAEFYVDFENIILP